MYFKGSGSGNKKTLVISHQFGEWAVHGTAYAYLWHQ